MKEDKTNTTNKSEVILNEATDTNKDSTEKENIELEKNNDLTLNPNNEEIKETTKTDQIDDEIKKELHEKELKKTAKKKKKKAKKEMNKHLFSTAIFKENFKSHFKSLMIVSLGNALIMAIIIGILSGLHINSTSTALKDLFGNADTESTVKEGAISFYSAFDGCSVTFDTIKDGKEKINKTLEKVLELQNDKTTLAKIDALKLLYNGKYALTSGTDKQKHDVAKEYALQEAKKTFTSQTPETEQNLIIEVLGSFLDEYFKDSSLATKDLVNKVIENNLASIIAKNLNLNSEEEIEISELIKNLIKDYNSPQANKKEVLEGYSIRFFKFVAGNEKEFATDLSNVLYDTFNKDRKNYIEDKSIENKILKEKITTECLKTIGSIAYIKYLPDFVVDYYTSNFGYPITYVKTGEYNENGTEKLKMIEVKLYNPDVYIKKESKMGTTSSLVEKLHKEVITGVPYTNEELDSAKDEAIEDVKKIAVVLDNYFTDYIKNYENYHENGQINDDLLLRKAVVLVKKVAEEQLISDYNKNNKVQISSIDEITVNNYSMDGKELMQYVDNYAASGITSYKTYKADAIKNGYNKNEAQLIAVSKGSLGVINQLPTSIQDSLTEMGDMNTYGIIVGVIAFGIAVLLIPMVYTVLTANSLVSEKIESGSLAFTMEWFFGIYNVYTYIKRVIYFYIWHIFDIYGNIYGCLFNWSISYSPINWWILW